MTQPPYDPSNTPPTPQQPAQLPPQQPAQQPAQQPQYVQQPVYLQSPPQPPPSAWWTFWVTFLFGLFGLIPAAIGASRAKAVGAPSSKYWKAFAGALAASLVIVVGGIVAIVLAVNHAAAVDRAAALTVGTCYQLPDNSNEHAGDHVVPCSVPHDGEILVFDDYEGCRSLFEQSGLKDLHAGMGLGTLADGREQCSAVTYSYWKLIGSYTAGDQVTQAPHD